MSGTPTSLDFESARGPKRRAQDRTLRRRRSDSLVQPTRRKLFMNTKSKIVIAAVAGAALGATAIQGLHAQAKLKAYSVAELEVIGTLPPDYLPTVRKAIEAAHGHTLRTVNGRVVSIEGAPAPKNAAIVEWGSVDDAVAFYKSKAWTDLAPQRENAQKKIRRYV